MITVPAKDVGGVREKRDKNAIYKKSLEDRNEDYIKSDMGDLE